MTLITERPHEQYGSAVFTRKDMALGSSFKSDANNIETLTVVFENLAVTSFYKPAASPFNTQSLVAHDISQPK